MDTSKQDLSIDDFCGDLLNSFDSEWNRVDSSQDSLTSLIRMLENGNNIEERLQTAQKLVLEFMSSTSILVVDNQILKHLLPALKGIHVNIFKEIENIVDNDCEKLPEQLNMLHKQLQMCINVLEILDRTLECILKNTQFGLCDVQTLPIHIFEMLLITFEHCKKSNVLYKECRGDLQEIFTIFKLACDLHNKILKLLVQHIHISDVSEEMVSLLKDVLLFLVKIGEVLSCMNFKAFANNWIGYVAITQKFSSILREHSFSIKEPINYLSAEIEKTFINVLNKDNVNVQNLNSIIGPSNFCVKIVLKLCELFLWNSEINWEAVVKFLLSVYKYYPSLLVAKGYPESACSQIKSTVFSEVDILLGKLCCKTEFYKTLQKSKETQLPSSNCFLLFICVFKNLCAVVKTDSNIAKSGYVHATIPTFFSILDKGYSEFWEVIGAAFDKKDAVYDNNVTNISYIILSLNADEYNQIENILLKNVFAENTWMSLLAVDIWYMVLRAEQPKFRYNSLCNIIEQTKFLFVEDVVMRPQLIFLKNLMKRIFGILTEDYRKMLLDKYPLYQNVRLWEILGFKHFPKTEVIAIAAEIINVVHKANLFLARKCNLKDFKILCTGLDTLSSIPTHPELETAHLILSLYRLWQFIFSNTSYDSHYFKYFIHKLIAITNNFLLDFNNEKLLLILTKINQLLNCNSDIKISVTTTLNTLSKKSITKSPEQNQIYALISEMFYQLLTDQNPIINQYALEVFIQFANYPQNRVIAQNSIKDNQLQTRISNYISYRVDNGTLNTEEYFRLQSKYEFYHCCLAIPKSILGHTQTAEKENIPVNENVQDVIIKRIKTDVELFHKVSGNENLAHESIVQIMKILYR